MLESGYELDQLVDQRSNGYCQKETMYSVAIFRK